MHPTWDVSRRRTKQPMQRRMSWIFCRYQNVWSKWIGSEVWRHYQKERAALAQIDMKDGEKTEKVQKVIYVHCLRPPIFFVFRVMTFIVLVAVITNWISHLTFRDDSFLLLALHEISRSMNHKLKGSFNDHLMDVKIAQLHLSTRHEKDFLASWKCELCAAKHRFSIKIK